MRSRDSIAIVGMACRFPGAGTPAEFWEILRQKYAQGDISREEFEVRRRDLS